jgi:esterase/lipase superfamily enzyme
MAAADIDVDEFRQLAQKMKQSTDTLTVYVSGTDKALQASKDLARYGRLGQAGPGVVLIPGIDTIDATDVDRGFFWDIDHSYFGETTTVVDDLFELIPCGWKVGDRDALRSVGSRDPRLWRLVANAPRRNHCAPSF